VRLSEHKGKLTDRSQLSIIIVIGLPFCYYDSYWDQPKNHDEDVKQIQHDISFS
jgi:hypothetical protein